MPVAPIRKQYLQIKQRYPDAVVLFRLGDFYETFEDDARIASRELEITLTSREMGKGQRVPMAGIPYHALDNYLARLISRGYKVAICEQLSPPGKGLVDRDVIRVVTPGTVVEPSLLDSHSNNYLAGLVSDGEKSGLAYVDITTAEFTTAQIPSGQVATELERLKPREIVVPQGSDALEYAEALVTRLDDYWFGEDVAREKLLRHFGVVTLEGYGCNHLPLAVKAAGAVIRYLEETQMGPLGQLTHLSTYSLSSFMVMDAHTRRNLEVFESAQKDGKSLLSVIDMTRTPMGGRLLRKWLGQPLLDINEIERRQAKTTWFCRQTVLRQEIRSLLGAIGDLERLVNRVTGAARPHELVSLRRGLERVPDIKSLVESLPDSPLPEIKVCPEVAALIDRAISDAEGEVIKPGFSPDLDELRRVSAEGRKYLASLERRERERTGIKSLKVKYNQVFGYYIEVSRANLGLVPQDYVRKQTLSEAERFFTAELKDCEASILNVKERVSELEDTLLRQVCQQIAGSAELVLDIARTLAGIDVVSSLAEVAVRYNYVCPEVNDGSSIRIAGGRHPVVERCVDGFIPNDTHLDNHDAQLIILTGPNMAGKSTYLRQVALIVLLAQVGSFVPADAASIGAVDRVFTRIGAQENLAGGQSTFLVEMLETASIVNSATSRSLLVLDEIGRGTSTYDGISIAWAVAEFIHNHPGLGAKTLFATHYHELVELAKLLPRVRNLNVAVSEEGGKVVFLRKVIAGGADRSYGIHVAELAGLPRAVTQRAREILGQLEARRGGSRLPQHIELSHQLSLFQTESALADEILGLDMDSMSPLQAIARLYELKEKARANSNIKTQKAK